MVTVGFVNIAVTLVQIKGSSNPLFSHYYPQTPLRGVLVLHPQSAQTSTWNCKENLSFMIPQQGSENVYKPYSRITCVQKGFQ